MQQHARKGEVAGEARPGPRLIARLESGGGGGGGRGEYVQAKGSVEATSRGQGTGPDAALHRPRHVHRKCCLQETALLLLSQPGCLVRHMLLSNSTERFMVRVKIQTSFCFGKGHDIM